MACWMSFKTDVSTALRSCPATMGFTASWPPVRPGAALRIVGLVLLTLTATQAAAEDDRKLGQNFPFAYALRGCTQEDAPALEIYLTQVGFNGEGTPSPPYLRIEIASPPTETIGRLTLQLIPLRRDPAKPGRIVRAELMESGHK